MKRILIAMAVLALGGVALAAEVLMVADEIPAMEILAGKLKAEENLTSQIVTQDKMPADLAPFGAVVVYIHRNLEAAAEKAFIKYTQAGGKLVVLHHSISSGKRKNQEWFPFLGISLPQGDVAQGGYKWIEPVTIQVVNVAPSHFITTHKVNYPEQIAYTRSDGASPPAALPGFALPESEVYLNHTFTAPRTLLLGLKYTDAKTAKVYMQDRAGWLRQSGQGWIIYLLPGHSGRDFENPAYARLVLNAIIFKP